MLKFKLIVSKGILVLAPEHALQAADFAALSSVVDDYLSTHDTLKGVLIHTKKFPGWHDFAGLMAHMQFVRAHHRFVEKIALATDTIVADVARVIVGRFIHAKIKHFQYADDEPALHWLEDNTAS